MDGVEVLFEPGDIKGGGLGERAIGRGLAVMGDCDSLWLARRT